METTIDLLYIIYTLDETKQVIEVSCKRKQRQLSVIDPYKRRHHNVAGIFLQIFYQVPLKLKIMANWWIQKYILRKYIAAYCNKEYSYS